MTSRRSFLAAIGASSALASAPVPAASPDPAETAFLRWLALVGAANSADHLGDDDPLWDQVHEAEDALVFHSPPSPSKAAVLAIHELVYATDDAFADDQTLAGFAKGSEACRLAIGVLVCLRAGVGREMSELAADLLDDLTRPAWQSRLGQAYIGRPV